MKKETSAKTTKSTVKKATETNDAAKTVDAKKTTTKKVKAVPALARPTDENELKDEAGVVVKEYNPGTRSVLDSPDSVSGPVFRYSDEELAEFKDLIVKRLDAARENLAYYQNLISRKDGMGDDSDIRLNSMEDGSGAMEKEQVAQLAARQIQFINNLDKALVRIENKTYGICRVTGKLIDKARLKAVPHATLSIEAKNAQR